MAEDNPVNQEVALTILRKNGIRADAVGNGLEAVKALQDIPYNLVLMDVQMPEMDGLEATRLIRSPASRVLDHAIPIIAMTANAMSSDHDDCQAAGMDDYLTKPVQPVQLIQRIMHWVERQLAATAAPAGAEPTPAAAPRPAQPAAGATASRAPAPLPPPGALLPPDAAQEAALRFDLLCRRVLDDRDMALELLEFAAGRIDEELAGLRAAVETADLAQTQMIAHRLKGTAANLSAEPWRAASERLETAAREQRSAELAPLYAHVAAAAGGFAAAVETLLQPDGLPD